MLVPDCLPEDLETTTFAKREWKRVTDAAVANGVMTRTEVDAELADMKDYRREIVFGTAEKLGIDIEDLKAVSIVDAEVDQEITRMAKVLDNRITARARIIFESLGSLAYPGKDWEDLSIEEQDEFRRTAQQVIEHARSSETEAEADDELEEGQGWDYTV